MNSSDRQIAEATSAPVTGKSDSELYPLYLITGVLDAGFGSVFVLLAEIRDLFDLGSSGVGLIAGAGFVSSFIAQITMARFADRGHVRRMLGFGIVTAAIAMLILMVANSLETFVLGRTLFGFGAGTLMPAARRIVIAHDPRRAGELLGRLGAVQTTGFLAGPMFGSLMYQSFGLRATFAATLVLILACAPLVLRIHVRAGDFMRSDPGRPVLRTLLKTRRIQALLFAAAGYYGSFGVYEATWAIYLSDLGASQLFIGFNMTLFAVPIIFVAPFAGRLAERRGSMRVTCIAIAITVPFMAGYGLVESFWVLTALMTVQAVADAFAMPSSQLAVAEASGNDIAAGQGLFGATGLAAGAAVALTSGVVYESQGPKVLFLGVAGIMAICVTMAALLDRRSLMGLPKASAVAGVLEPSE